MKNIKSFESVNNQNWQEVSKEEFTRYIKQFPKKNWTPQEMDEIYQFCEDAETPGFLTESGLKVEIEHYNYNYDETRVSEISPEYLNRVHTHCMLLKRWFHSNLWIIKRDDDWFIINYTKMYNDDKVYDFYVVSEFENLISLLKKIYTD